MSTERTILVLGGTRFAGRAVVAEALGRGHRVTLFNRGRTDPDLFPGAEHLRGDRTSDLSALDGRAWDAVIDVAAYHPDVVRRSVETLAGHVGRYVFVSTLSVYAGHATTADQREDAPLLGAAAAGDPALAYGAHKAGCEAVLTAALGERATIARPGLLVGPHDPTERFVYWPRRLAGGGRVLAPGRPEDPLQFLDVRDLAAWLVDAAGAPDGDSTMTGGFNLAGLPVPFGALLDACPRPPDTELVWIPSDRLLAAGLDPWMGVPLWIGAPGWEAANAVDSSRARTTGLRHRPVAATIQAALAQPGYSGETSMPPEREQELLLALAEPGGRERGEV
jgi:2'-hydroxyisoflavone reductase